jgi:chromosomal replication initiation ATPase DnaA
MTGRQIIAAVAQRWRLSADDLIGPSHKPRPATARKVAVRTVHAERPDLSYRKIGKLFNRSKRYVHYALHS